jgi:multimeric flavodoxin WrbA
MPSRKEGHCIINDDHVNETSDKIAAADGLILGSPVHFSSMAALASSFFGRLFYPSSACRAGSATSRVRRWFLPQRRRYGYIRADHEVLRVGEMPTVSSMYWNIIHGNTPEEVMKDEEGVQIMRVLGRDMAWMLKCIEAGKPPGYKIPPMRTR